MELCPGSIYWRDGEIIANKWVQNNLGRRCPSFADSAPINAFSFPSGHTGAAAAFLGFWIIFLLIKYPKRMLAKVLISVPAVALALASLCRIFLLDHWTTDGLAGFCFALASILLCFWINERMQPAGLLDSTSKCPYNLVLKS